MKQTIFTADEKSLLQKVLEKRMVYLNGEVNGLSSIDEKKRLENSHIKPLRSALDKITRPEPSIITENEKRSLIICVNIQIDECYNELKSLTALSCLNISDDLRKAANELDNCRDILSKFGYEFQNDKKHFMLSKEFRFGDVLSDIDKLKQTDKVLLSYSGLNNYYKIAFIYRDKEYLLFDLNYQVSLKDIVFASLNGQSPEDFAKEQFNLTTNKSKAKELIAMRLEYPDGVLELMNAMLS